MKSINRIRDELFVPDSEIEAFNCMMESFTEHPEEDNEILLRRIMQMNATMYDLIRLVSSLKEEIDDIKYPCK